MSSTENTLYATIKEIKEDMAKTAKGSHYDPEAAHGHADSLLVQLVEVLALTNENSSDILQIVADYENVDKWYA